MPWKFRKRSLLGDLYNFTVRFVIKFLKFSFSQYAGLQVYEPFTHTMLAFERLGCAVRTHCVNLKWEKRRKRLTNRWSFFLTAAQWLVFNLKTPASKPMTAPDWNYCPPLADCIISFQTAIWSKRFCNVCWKLDKFGFQCFLSEIVGTVYLTY